ncbi:MAG: OmpA family protein [Sulfurimonadaceae bacterium]|jgi:peptidoglycan-associated lipoprotein|nr:OmpA family protein [Sulfurimonadaceae bacterium]
MKSILVSSVFAAALLFSGCSDKDPKVDDSSDAVQEVVAPTPAPTSGGEKIATPSESISAKIARLEGELQTINFDFDKFNINSANSSKVPANASIIKSEAAGLGVKLEGNCDEWGSDEYNMALGLKRANSVKQAIVAEGVSESSITMVSYGESNPVCTEKTKDCWAKNRRVDFKLLP